MLLHIPYTDYRFSMYYKLLTFDQNRNNEVDVKVVMVTPASITINFFAIIYDRVFKPFYLSIFLLPFMFLHFSTFVLPLDKTCTKLCGG